MMRFLTTLFLKFSQWQYAILAILVLAILLHMGTAINGGFYADDYFQRSYVTTPPALIEKGLLGGVKMESWLDYSRNQFLFFDAENANYKAMLDFGVLPWYMHDETKLHFYRPLSAVLHFIEYKNFPDSPRLMHLISLLWYVFGLWMIYIFYRAVDIKKSIAIFAMLLLILDNSVFHVVSWIAGRNMLLVIALGFAALYAYHRGVSSRFWYFSSVVLLLLSLLAGEGGIGICAYLGAYMFTLDSRTWNKRLLAILPMVAVTIAWRWHYQVNGYGAFSTEFYVDPGHSPLHFLQRALWQFPGNFFELVMGIDTLTGQVRPDVRQNFAYFGIAIFGLLLWLLKKPLQENKSLQFFALACIFSLVPGLAVVLSSRVMILPNIGFAIVLASIFYYSAKGFYSGAQKITASVFIIYGVLMHLVIGFLLAVFITVSTMGLLDDDAMKRGGVQLGVDDYADKSLIIMNAEKPFWVPFIAFELEHENKKLPAHLRVISSSFHSLTVKRIDEKTLTISGEPALQLDADAVSDMSDQPAGHYGYLSQRLMGLFRKSDAPWYTGMQRDFDDVRISILSLRDIKGIGKKPETLELYLKNPLTEYSFVYWHKETKNYQTFLLPEIGQEIFIIGVFDEN